MNEEELFGQLEDTFKTVDDDPHLINLQEMPVEWLATKHGELDQWLLKHHQVINLNPNTQEARDVHAERNAIRLELHRRGLI